MDCLVYHVDRLYHTFCTLLSVNPYNNQLLESLSVSLLNTHDVEERYMPQVLETSRGCPRINIQKEQLEYLLHMGFSCPKVANVLGVSLGTVRRLNLGFPYHLCILMSQMRSLTAL